MRSRTFSPCLNLLLNGSALGVHIWLSTVPEKVLRIDRTGSTITYYRNGVALSYQNTSAVSSALMADISLTTSPGTLANLRTSFGQTSQTVARRFEYDHAGRLSKVYHKLNSDTEVLLVQNEYNEIGQLVDKKLHSTDGTNFKQSIDHRYNIRGWLTSINNSKL